MAAGTAGKLALHPQLAEIQAELEAATSRARQLVAALDDAQWRTQPAAGRWSPCECLMHLNITTREYLPLLHSAAGRGREKHQQSSGPFKMDFWGRLLSWFLEPPYRVKAKTGAKFAPASVEPAAAVLAEFEKGQEALAGVLRYADGLALDKILLTSPFNEKLKFNFYSTLKTILAHQRRHLWQAEQATAKRKS